MSGVYYVFKSGRIKRKKNTVYLEFVENGETQKRPIPVERIKAIYIFGEVDLNTKFLNFASQREIVIHFFNYYGFYSGSFFPRKRNVSGILVVNQVKHYIDKRKRLAIAKEFVKGAVFHIKRNLRYYKNRGSDTSPFLERIEEIEKEIDLADSIPVLMSAEGRIREVYYQSFNSFLNLDEKFESRVRRPPNNKLNALISFGNALIYTETLSQIYRTHLDPTVSFLHEPSTRRFSLSLDISEVFKPMIIDRIIFRMINRNELSDSDFGSIGKAKGVYLSERGRKKFVSVFEEAMNKTIKHRKLRRSVSYRTLIRYEAYRLIRHLLGIETYRAFRAWW